MIKTYELTAEESARIIMEHLGVSSAKFQYVIEITGQAGVKLTADNAKVIKVLITEA